MTMTYRASDARYGGMTYRRTGKWGLKLPVISLGLWQNFGGTRDYPSAFEILSYAFDKGITHFDLANNYGPPPGSAEELFGDVMARDFRPYRDEMIVSSKAGYLMWDGPYGEWGSRKYVMASAEQSLKRLGLDYVDIFYSHRYDPNTPLEETMGALAQLHRQGKALYVGISSYPEKQTREAHRILKDMGVPCLIHQPSYSMINRWVEEDGLLDTVQELGIGTIVFSPLAQGMLTSKYLDGIPEGSRATQGKSLRQAFLNERTLENIRALDAIAKRRGQTLAQMAIAWVLRVQSSGSRVTTALIGASRPEQVEDSVGALKNPHFTDAELAEIDQYAREGDINIWAASAERQGPARK
jgi:L-glyceraldehyde 3-phosphate reductase